MKNNKREETKVSVNNDNSIDAVLNNKLTQFELKPNSIYSYKELAYELLCLHKCKFKYRSWDRINSRLKLFNQHIDSFKAEIDWLQIINSIAKLKEQVKEVMEKNQQVLDAFHQTRYVDQTIAESEYSSGSKMQDSNEKENKQTIERYLES